MRVRRLIGGADAGLDACKRVSMNAELPHAPQPDLRNASASARPKGGAQTGRLHRWRELEQARAGPVAYQAPPTGQPFWLAPAGTVQERVTTPSAPRAILNLSLVATVSDSTAKVVAVPSALISTAADLSLSVGSTFSRLAMLTSVYSPFLSVARVSDAV